MVHRRPSRPDRLPGTPRCAAIARTRPLEPPRLRSGNQRLRQELQPLEALSTTANDVPLHTDDGRSNLSAVGDCQSRILGSRPSHNHHEHMAAQVSGQPVAGAAIDESGLFAIWPRRVGFRRFGRDESSAGGLGVVVARHSGKWFSPMSQGAARGCVLPPGGNGRSARVSQAFGLLRRLPSIADRGYGQRVTGQSVDRYTPWGYAMVRLEAPPP
jgi:hypothetical protein